MSAQMTIHRNDEFIIPQAEDFMLIYGNIGKDFFNASMKRCSCVCANPCACKCNCSCSCDCPSRPTGKCPW